MLKKQKKVAAFIVDLMRKYQILKGSFRNYKVDYVVLDILYL